MYLDCRWICIPDQYHGLYSRKIIAWTLSKTLEVSCVLDTINKAKATRKLTNPLVIHSDRGSQYVSKEYQKAASKNTQLLEEGVSLG
ncbi:DDE-type integrase/transposase/recombinase [Thermoanaerobacterium xylanolyticum]|uniref:DDE-type integrase/transposase/recombinase n=1 Tax=Thermoanaerobacterium xylanolyticum TaxID=29329 RepID=UPI003D79BC15